jgi:hypothetical protein
MSDLTVASNESISIEQAKQNNIEAAGIGVDGDSPKALLSFARRRR